MNNKILSLYISNEIKIILLLSNIPDDLIVKYFQRDVVDDLLFLKDFANIKHIKYLKKLINHVGDFRIKEFYNILPRELIKYFIKGLSVWIDDEYVNNIINN